MKYKYFFLIFILTQIHASCSRNTLPIQKAVWVNNWPDDSRPVLFDSTSGVYYLAQRDENNLYLHLKTSELATQMKILRYGLSIHFNDKGNKKEKAGFTFPIEFIDTTTNQRAYKKEGRGDSERPRSDFGPEEMQRRILERTYNGYLKRPKEIILNGFDGIPTKKIILGKDPSYIQVDLELGTDNTLNYYAVVPMKKITEGKIITIGFESGFSNADSENSPSMGGPGGGRPIGGRQAQLSEEDRAKRRAFFMKMTEQMSSPSEFWFSVDIDAIK